MNQYSEEKSTRHGEVADDQRYLDSMTKPPHGFLPLTLYFTAQNAGSTSIMEPMIRPHGDQMAGFVDPERSVWEIASAQRTEGLA